jgi:RimJ/RimL family protein N-acetyltransferase
MNISGKNIQLKLLTPDNLSNDYINWMQDDEVMQFTESRFDAYTLEDLKEYVKNVTHKDFFFGIFLKESGEHIGNIKIGGIDEIHRFADMGLIIGNKQMWGKGYGTETIQLATYIAFEELNLNKLIAGIYSNNMASYAAFMKAGYKEAGRLKKHYFYKGTYVDKIYVETLKDLEHM